MSDGVKQADLLIETHESLPRTVALVLWGSDNIKSDGVPIAPDVNVIAEYPIVVTRDADDPATARAFVSFVVGDEGRAILEPHLSDSLQMAPTMLEAARRQGTYPLGLALTQVVRSMVASGEASEEGPANPSK